MTSLNRIKVLLISHTCQSATEGQPKAHALAKFPDLDLCVVSPERWFHYGKWRAADVPANPPFRYLAEKVRLPWLGPAQYYLHTYPRLSRILSDFRPDVIDLWEEPWSRVSVQTCRLRNQIVPTAKIVSETEQNINKTLPFPFERYRRFTLQNADYAVGRSEEAVRVLREKGYDGPAEAVPNAVDAELFRPMDRAAARAQLGIDGFLIGYVGRLVEEKGLADAIAALAQCPAEVKLLLIGAGPLEPELRQLAQLFPNRVHFLPARPLHELPSLMNALDVLVLPSRTTPRWKEQFGRVIIEAQACAVPVIGSTSGAIPEVIADAGLIVPERNPPALAKAFVQLLNDPALRTDLGRRGRQRIERHFTWDCVAARMRAIYLRCMNHPSSVA